MLQKRDASNTATDTTNAPIPGNNTFTNNNSKGSEKEAFTTIII